LEELCELAEAIRVFELHPKYFLGEAADTFSYLMGIANEHAMRLAQDGIPFSFEDEFLTRFPGFCVQCGSKVCVCPAVPAATVGRMAKEVDIAAEESPFIKDVRQFSLEGQRVGHAVLEDFGGPAGLSSKIPFDRGEANRALVDLCLRISDAVQPDSPDLADTLRAAALKISAEVQVPGSAKKPIDIDGLLSAVGDAWKKVDQEHRSSIKQTKGIVGELGEILDTTRVLFAFCSPQDSDQIRVHGEFRAIQECVARSADKKIVVHPLPAATATDFRRELLNKRYDVIHFAGHANEDSLVFEDEKGNSTTVPLSALSEAVGRLPAVKVVILNGCETGKNLTVSIAPHTIAMSEAVDDEAAIEFTKGFYDALVLEKSIREAYEEGLTAVRFAGFNADHIKMLTW
jgi:hypothetical protein